MRILISLMFATATIAMAGAPTAATDSGYSQLLVYQGAWRVARKDMPAGAKPDELRNQCASLGAYFACQQTVNGQPSALLVFVKTATPGRFHTQNIAPDGIARGRGDLQISGNQWVYTTTWDNSGTTMYNRNINVFTDKNHIHYEQAESTNGTQWTVKNSGDEVRVGFR